MKKILFIITLLLIGISNVNAEPCDAYDIKRLKEIAEGVEITYELQEPIKQDYGEIRDVYKINIKGLTNELIVINRKEGTIYDNSSDYNELIFSGIKYYDIKSKNCSSVLKQITLKLPVYNNFSDLESCKNNEYKNLKICQKWVESVITEKEYYDALNSIEEDKPTVKPKKNFNISIMFGVCVLIVIIICVYLKKKREMLI